jgi:hypothetical protein
MKIKVGRMEEAGMTSRQMTKRRPRKRRVVGPTQSPE